MSRPCKQKANGVRPLALLRSQRQPVRSFFNFGRVFAGSGQRFVSTEGALQLLFGIFGQGRVQDLTLILPQRRHGHVRLRRAHHNKKRRRTRLDRFADIFDEVVIYPPVHQRANGATS